MWRDCWIVLLSRPARALWIEIKIGLYPVVKLLGSRPARALWIEICRLVYLDNSAVVEAREGLVD